MSGRKRHVLPGVLRLPDPAYAKRRKSRQPKCSDCRGILSLTRGQAYCEQCSLTTPIPIGRVASIGHHNGKYVYLKSILMKEIREDYADIEDQKAALFRELKDRNILFIEEIDS